MPQIKLDNQPVTQITIVEPEPGKQEEAISLMKERAQFMSSQPGFISVSLHRSLDGRRIINYIQWQSRELLQSAHQSRNSERNGGSSTRSRMTLILTFTRWCILWTGQ